MTPERDERAAALARVERFDRRVGRLSHEGHPAGEIFVYAAALLPNRWDRWFARRRKRPEPYVAWLLEFTPAFASNGYTDEAGDVGLIGTSKAEGAAAADIAEQANNWERGLHEHDGRWFEVTWLDAQASAEVRKHHGWDW